VLRDLLYRSRALFRRDAVEAELDEELREHFERQVETYIAAGLTCEEAQRRTRLEFGGLDQVKEECRDARGVSFTETLLQDIRFSLRLLRKTPTITAIALLSLALGIGANTAIFSLIDAVMLRMLPVPSPEELLQVRMVSPGSDGEGNPVFTNPIWEQLRDQQDVFSGAFAWDTDRFDLTQGGAVHYANGLWVSGGYFNGLQLLPAAGRLISTSDDQPGCAGVAVLSYGFWQEHYGGAPGAVGSTISLNRHPFEVVGVSSPGFSGMDVGDKFDVALPICATRIFDDQESRLDHRSWWWLSVAGRAKPGIAPGQLKAHLSVLSPRVFSESVPNRWAPKDQERFMKRVLVTAPAATGTSYLRRQFNQPLTILMALVALVLLIACANIASLMLARGAARHKEIAVRQALGASRPRLIRQLLTECILLSLAGALMGVLFARWGTALLVRFISTSRNVVFLDLSLDGRVLGFTAAVALFTGILFGLLPALRATRVSVTSAMKGNQSPESERPTRFRVRHWIVASQVALSLVLLVAGGLLLRSFAKLATLDIGFDRNNVLLVNADLQTVRVPAEQQENTYQQIENRLRVLPGVVSVGRSILTPVSGFMWNNTIGTEWSRSVTGDSALADLNYVSPGFFPTLRMTVLAGRNFSAADTKASPAVAVVNRLLAGRFFPGVNPLGKTFRIYDGMGKPGPPFEVVGIVRDAKYGDMREEEPPTAFFPATQIPEHAEQENFELRTAMRPSSLAPAVQAAVAEVNNQIPLEFHTLAQQVNDSMVQERLLALLSGFFGVVALLLAMIGLFGTFSYLVTQRRIEFGVRMALGARPGSILRLVMSDLIAVLAGGLVAGACISLAATRALQQMLFGLGPRDAITMIGAAGVLSAVALLAGYLPARRAMRVDPMIALRYE
jgi:putative ABC transport system permease protein